MAVRFIMGRAGTGKTRYCVEALARALAKEPLGPPLIWLVPEQATFNAERMLVTHPAVRGMFRASVTGFRRLAHLVAVELGISQGSHMDDLGRVILLEKLVQEQRGKLKLFGRVADRPGFIANLDRMLRELQQHGHSPQTLRDLVTRMAAGRGDAVLADKLADLALLLEAWQAALADRNLDPDLLQQNVADRLGESALVRGAHVWVDAFSALNVLEMRTLVALAQTAAAVEITLLADPDAPAIGDPMVMPDPLSPFYRTERLYRQLLRTFEKARVVIEPAVMLRDPPPYRFKQAEDLARIERDLFVPEPPVAQEQNPPAQVQLMECANPEIEVQAAAQRIRQLMARDATLRYRDIGIIIPDLEGYQDAVRRIFTQHHIPHFVDMRRPITHHPLVELVRTAVALPLGNFSLDDLVLLVKTGLTNISEDDANVLENYLLGHGITRHNLALPFVFAAPNQSDEDDEGLTEAQRAHLAKVNEIRKSLHGALAPWFEAALVVRTSKSATRTFPGPLSDRADQEVRTTNPGNSLTRELFALLERFDVERKMVELMNAARAAGHQELFMIHQQAWRQLIKLLETLDHTLQDQTPALGDFARILSVALESLTLGLIPPTVDQVLVSSVARSRHPEMRIALILGALETRFPLIRSEDPLFNDFQRGLFNEMAGDPIGAGTAEDLVESKFLDYIAFTRASERLIVSYPIADHKGKAVVKSQYIGRLMALFPGLKAQVVDAQEVGALERLATREDLTAAVLGWGRREIAQVALSHQPRASATELQEIRMAAAYNWLIGTGDQKEQDALARAWLSLLPVVRPRIDAALAARFYGHELRMSVSQLEKYGSCPLQYFMHYTLGLRQRFVMQLEILDIGILYHRILERVYDCIIDGEWKWPDCDVAALQATLARETQAAAEELHAELSRNSPQYPKVRWRAVRNIGLVLEAQRRTAMQGDLQPAATEVVFGRKSDAVQSTRVKKISLPLLSIKTPGQRVAGLNGKIDRVDISRSGNKGVVIDYKSSGKTQRVVPLYEIYYGISLQLPIYLLVLRHCGQEFGARPSIPLPVFWWGCFGSGKRRMI